MPQQYSVVQLSFPEPGFFIPRREDLHSNIFSLPLTPPNFSITALSWWGKKQEKLSTTAAFTEQNSIVMYQISHQCGLITPACTSCCWSHIVLQHPSFLLFVLTASPVSVDLSTPVQYGGFELGGVTIQPPAIKVLLQLK